MPYAKPVQLYLCNEWCFLGVGKFRFHRLYTNLFDYQYYSISDYKIFKWAKPADEAVENSMLNLIRAKQKISPPTWTEDFTNITERLTVLAALLRSKTVNDSFILTGSSCRYMPINGQPFIQWKFESHIATYGKSLIFFILPLMGRIFFLLFLKNTVLRAAALILSVHFMVYNMLMYLVTSAIFTCRWNGLDPNAGATWWCRSTGFLQQIHRACFLHCIWYSFEFMHLVFWMPWFFVAFKRLFNTVWWKTCSSPGYAAGIFFLFYFWCAENCWSHLPCGACTKKITNGKGIRLKWRLILSLV